MLFAILHFSFFRTIVVAVASFFVLVAVAIAVVFVDPAVFVISSASFA